MANYGEIEYSTEIVKNRLYFAVTYDDRSIVLKSTPDIYYFNIDDELIYYNYYYDFGPLNLSCLYKYCCKLNSYMQGTSSLKRIVHYTSADQNKRSNAAYLIGSYAVLYLKMEPRHIFRLLIQAGGPYKNFLDASQGTSLFTLRLIDCLQAIEKAMLFNFFDFNDFNTLEYDTHSKLQYGDMNWLVPRKFIAFIGPTDFEVNHTRPPEHYIKYFLKNDIRTVIRLNNKTYNSFIFKQAGIHHFDLFFPDGTTPPRSILLRFLEIAENSTGAIAVHCKAGLGRTGSLIGAFIVKHYQMSARETIAWLRICRPGCVIGQQQDWLEKIEGWLWRQGISYRLQHFGGGDKIPRHKYGVYSKIWPIHRKKILQNIRSDKSEKASQYTTCRSQETESITDDFESESGYSNYNVQKRNVAVDTSVEEDGMKLMYAKVRPKYAVDASEKKKSKPMAFFRNTNKNVSSQGDNLNAIKYTQEYGNNNYNVPVTRRNYETYTNPINYDSPDVSQNHKNISYTEYFKNVLNRLELRKRLLGNRGIYNDEE